MLRIRKKVMSLKRSELFKKYYKSDKHDYEISETLEACPDLNIAFVYSGRQRGKSFEIASQCLADAWYDDKQLAYIRRHVNTIGDIEKYFADKTQFIKDMTDNTAEGITMQKGILYFYKWVENEKTGSMRKNLIKQLGYSFSVSKEGSYRSLQYPEVYNAIYEEVLTSDGYLSGEPDKFLNLWSTIGRTRPGFRTWLISNTVSIVNPYSRAWGLDLAKNKPGDIKITKLYLQSYDKDGHEEFLIIAAHYLQDRNEMSKEDLKKTKGRNRIRTGIRSNKWDELRLYTTVDLGFFRQFKPLDTVIFEHDDIMIQCNLVEIPSNTLEVYLQDDPDNKDPIELNDELMPVLYFRRKTGEIKPGTRVYTNNPERFSPLVTKGFKIFYQIDKIIKAIYDRGWIIGADNLTMNDFREVWKHLNLISL